MQAGGHIKNLVQNGTLLVISITVALVFCEVVVRVFDIGPEIQVVSFENHQISENPVLGYELIPNSWDGKARINGDGMRDRDYAPRKPANTFRIAVVGDSITFGYNVEARDTYAKRLEELLNKDLEGAWQFEVMNFGVSGYNVIQVAENLRTKVLKYDPDLLLYGYCLNDPQEYSHEMERLLDRLQSDERYYLNARRHSRGLLAHSKLFLLTRYMFELSTQDMQAAGEEADVSTDPQFTALRSGNHVSYFRGIYSSGDSLQRLQKGLEMISNATDAPLVVVIFPIFGELEDYPLSSVHELVKKEFLDHGHQVIDLLDAYAHAMGQRGHALNYEPLHPTPDGHLLAAEVIADYLVETGEFAQIWGQSTVPE